jgi:hypothetical protein
MLRSTANALAFGACLMAFASLDALHQPLARAAIAVALGVLMTVVAYGEATFVSVGAGAVSPLAFALLEKQSLGAATFALSFAWIAPRLLLAESRKRIALLAVASVAASLVAGFVFAAYVDAPIAVHAASCVFAGSCLSLVGLIPVETHVSFALRTAASAIASDAKDALERAARMHRLSPKLQAKRWRELVRLADERAAAERATAAGVDATRQDLDARIVALVEELAPREPAPVTTPLPAEVTAPMPAATPEPVPDSPAETPVEVSFEPNGPDAADTTAE